MSMTDVEKIKAMQIVEICRDMMSSVKDDRTPLPNPFFDEVILFVAKEMKSHTVRKLTEKRRFGNAVNAVLESNVCDSACTVLETLISYSNHALSNSGDLFLLKELQRLFHYEV